MKPAVHAHVPHLGLPGLLTLIVGMTLSCPAHGGAGVWTSGGPYGEDVVALAVSPTPPGTLYAGTAFGGVFKSVDSGNTWAVTGQ